MGQRPRNLGFSLVEMLIAVAIQGIFILVIATVLLQVARIQGEISEQAKLEETALKIGYAVRSILSQAVDVDWAGNTDLNSGCCGGRGRIRAYETFTYSPVSAAASVDTLGVFWREAAGSGVAVAGSEFRSTALYYQKQTPDTSGVLYVNLGSTAAGPLEPTLDGLVFDGLVGFAIEDPQPGDVNQPVAAVRVRYVLRRFMDPNAPGWKWCAPGFSGAAECTTSAYRDSEQEFEVSFRNNVLGPARFRTAGQQRLFDQIYFFRTIAPIRSN